MALVADGGGFSLKLMHQESKKGMCPILSHVAQAGVAEQAFNSSMLEIQAAPGLGLAFSFAVWTRT